MKMNQASLGEHVSLQLYHFFSPKDVELSTFLDYIGISVRSNYHYGQQNLETNQKRRRILSGPTHNSQNKNDFN